MENLIFGIVTGSILLLGAVGFAMVRRIENFLNIAHGQLIAVGAYFAWALNHSLGLALPLAAVLAVVLTSAISYGCWKFVYQPIRATGPLMLLFTSVGIAYILNGLIEATWGVTTKTYRLGEPHIFRIGTVPLMNLVELAILLIAMASAMALHLFLVRTKVGTAIRAMASDYHLARARGIDAKKISGYVWVVAGGLAGLAGVLVGLNAVIYPDMGWTQILLILSAAVLGGLGGSIYGVMLSSVVIGIVMDMSTLFLPASYRSAVAFAVVVLALFWRPQGLLGGEL